MNARVTGFPFSVLEHPMYDGATLSFLGSALFSGSSAGVLLSIEAFTVYRIAAIFEGYVVVRICFARLGLVGMSLTFPVFGVCVQLVHHDDLLQEG